jgi:UDP-N-acetylglucosamine 4-epimerase
VSHYLVTGGAGFIGSNIALRLAKSGAKVRVFDNFASGMSRVEFDSIFSVYADLVEVVEGDVRDIDICRMAMRGISHVLHHAAISSALYSIDFPLETISVNVVGTVNLLTAARDSGTVERFINASSCAVYGDGSSNSKAESGLLYPGTPYATSMHAAESLCSNFFRSHKLFAGSLRYFNVYGPSELTSGRVRSAVAQFIDAPLHKHDITIYGDGNQTRDFVHIDDAVTAALHLCECKIEALGGQIYNVGTGVRFSILELLDLVSVASGWSIDCIQSEARSHEIKHSKADVMKASSMLGFNSIINLEHGVLDMLNVVHQDKLAA